MNRVLGIDTSNYTCSAALFDADTCRIFQAKQLLPVKSGEKGIRQSDAVFHHTQLLPEMIDKLGCTNELCAVGVSDRPSCREGSYMPCFTVGLGAARIISAVSGIPYYNTTHQTGHILAALYSADKLDLIREKKSFIAFHVSGGTTDVLLCSHDDDALINVKRVGGSNDLKAGQAIDRCGVMLGLDFPCGAELEKLAAKCNDTINVKPSISKNECSFSGIENRCRKLMQDGAEREYIAAYCIKSVSAALVALTKIALSECGQLPLIYAGGVMSDKIIADSLSERFDAYFAKPEFSCDNASGVALFAAFKKGMI